MAIAYKFVDEKLGISSLPTQVDATQLMELGYIALAKDATFGVGEFQYVKFTGTVAAGDFVVTDRNGLTCTQSPAGAPGANKFSAVGVAMGAAVNGQFGWIMIRGVHDSANVTAALTVGTVLSGGAVAGRCNQGVANYSFDGSVLRVAGVAGAGTVELYWPSCSGR